MRRLCRTPGETGSAQAWREQVLHLTPDPSDPTGIVGGLLEGEPDQRCRDEGQKPAGEDISRVVHPQVAAGEADQECCADGKGHQQDPGQTGPMCP